MQVAAWPGMSQTMLDRPASGAATTFSSTPVCYCVSDFDFGFGVGPGGVGENMAQDRPKDAPSGSAQNSGQDGLKNYVPRISRPENSVPKITTVKWNRGIKIK